MKLLNPTLYEEVYVKKYPEMVVFTTHWGPSILSSNW